MSQQRVVGGVCAACGVGLVAVFFAGRVITQGPLFNLLGLAFWVLLALLIGGSLYYRGLRLRARELVEQRWAREHGWSYTERDDSVIRGVTGLPFISGAGSGRRDMAENVLRKLRTLPVAVPGAPLRDGAPAVELETVSFTYRWVVRQSYGIKSYAEVFVTAVRLPAALPHLTLMREDVASAAAKKLGVDDHQLESVEFNDQYLVWTDDPRSAHDVLHASLMRRLLEPDLAGLPWVIDQGWIRTWDYFGPRANVVDLHMHLLDEVVTSIRRYVWQDALAVDRA